MNLPQLDDQYSVLDRLPDTLYSTVISLPHGDLLQRADAILQWRSALLEGRLPDSNSLNWPERAIRTLLLKRLEALNIVHYCRDQETLCDQILIDICEGVTTAETYLERAPKGSNDKLAQRQKRGDRDSEFKNGDALPGEDNHDSTEQPQTDHNATPEPPRQPQEATENSHHTTSQKELNKGETKAEPHPAEADHSAIALANETTSSDHSAELSPSPINAPDKPISVNEQLEEDIPPASVTQIEAVIAARLEERWLELAESWADVSDAFTEFSGLLGQGWDLTQGELVSGEWRDFIKFLNLLKQEPVLQRLVEMLGRSQTVSASQSVAIKDKKRPKEPVVKIAHHQKSYRVPHVAMETGGLERSNALSRLLPAELAQLGHPQMKRLWFARYAERMLLTYQYKGFSPQARSDEANSQVQPTQPQQIPTKGMGPIIICLDTSGSMHGIPEQIAKAITLEALAIAFRESRRCYLYAFGGPDETLEHELDLTRGGLTKLLKFLRFSFHGGTDVTTPLLKALHKQRCKNWLEADILLISDGRFPLQDSYLNQIKQLKHQQGLRLHGLLVGKWKSRSMEVICEPLVKWSDF